MGRVISAELQIDHAAAQIAPFVLQHATQSPELAAAPARRAVCDIAWVRCDRMGAGSHERKGQRPRAGDPIPCLQEREHWPAPVGIRRFSSVNPRR